MSDGGEIHGLEAIYDHRAYDHCHMYDLYASTYTLDLVASCLVSMAKLLC